MALRDFVGCKAIIRGGEDHLLETNVLEYNRSQGIITLPALPFADTEFERALVLILHGNEMYEFEGTVRRYVRPGKVDIALYKEKSKQDRVDKRFAVRYTATVTDLLCEGVLRPLEKPQPVTVLDISSSGVCICTSPGLLGLSSTFKLRMMMGEKETMLNCCVVRVKNGTGNQSEYGCQFLSQLS